MGYLFDVYGMQLLDYPAREGACPVCADEHEEGMPHNRDSLLYQYRFFDEHGRWPSWLDAMAHCEPHVRQAWVEALEEEGVDVGHVDETINDSILIAEEQ